MGRRHSTSTTATTNLTISLYHTRLGIFALPWTRTFIGRSTHIHLLPNPRRLASSISSSFRLNLNPLLFWKKHGSKPLVRRVAVKMGEKTRWKAIEPSKEHLQFGLWLHALQPKRRLRPTKAGAEREKHWLKTQRDKVSVPPIINATFNEDVSGGLKNIGILHYCSSFKDQHVEKQTDGPQDYSPLSFEPTFSSVPVTALITENSPAHSNTPAGHALRAWAWSSGRSDGFGELWKSVCSWWWMLGTEFRGSVASLVLVVSGCRRAILKVSSPLVVVLLRSLWIVPFPLLVVSLWLATSFVESGLPRLVFDVALPVAFYFAFVFALFSIQRGRVTPLVVALNCVFCY